MSDDPNLNQSVQKAVFKSREELAALPEYERLRHVANRMWFAVAGGLVFGLQVAFLDGFRTIGLIMAAGAVLCIPCLILLTRRARRIRHRP